MNGVEIEGVCNSINISYASNVLTNKGTELLDKFIESAATVGLGYKVINID